MLPYSIVMRNRYDAEFSLTTVRRFRFSVDYALRIAHVALWLTMPTVFWLWLGSPPPAECVREYGWYKGNALCVSEDAHLWITFGLFLLGFSSIGCWIYGYCFDVISRVLRGDRRPPPLRLKSAVEGCGLFVMSLKYWLPAIAYLIVISVLASTLPLATRNHSYHALLLMGAPFALAMSWGFLVGLARYAAFGEHTLLYRRRENMRLALANFRLSLWLTIKLIAATVLCAALWFGAFVIPIPWHRLDFMSDAALGSLSFYVVLLIWTIAGSHVVARYAIKIGIGDHQYPSAAFE